MPLRAKTTKGKIHEEAAHLMAKSPKYSAREAHGVATKIVTGRGPKKKGRKMRKRYGEGHMDRGVSYANAPQGYRDDSGKPKANYGQPPNGYINQSGMPNASRMRRVMDYMSTYYGTGMAGGVSTSTNAGTAPSPAMMDNTYHPGQATIPSKKGKNKYS
jgi:hypothetical protein